MLPASDNVNLDVWLVSWLAPAFLSLHSSFTSRLSIKHLRVDDMTSQPLSGLFSGLNLGLPDPSSSTYRAQSSAMTTGLTTAKTSSSSTQSTTSTSTSTTTGSTNRLPPVMKKYMNPDLIRPPNTGLKSTYQGSEASRGPLLKLAGLNVPSPARPKQSLGKGKPGQAHTAHGLHGPAHSTTTRRVSSSIGTHQRHASVSNPAVSKKPEVGKNDGEGDEEKDAARAESMKILELESAPGGSVEIS